MDPQEALSGGRSTTFYAMEHAQSGHHDTFARSTDDDYVVLSSSSSSPASDAASFSTTESRPQSACDTTKSSQSVSGGDAQDTPDSSRASPAKDVSAGGKEKRKRSRVTAEQLVQLERIFASDRSPTAARRKEISDTLGMQERQTQIWFQNRRAKAKLQEEKMRSRGNMPEPPPDTPPALSQGFDTNLYNLIHEEDHVSIVPCSDLTIGTWRRIASTLSKHDLVAYVCEAKRCLTWYINSSGYGFKMVIPYDTVAQTKFQNISPGLGLATFTLSQAPQFYMEGASPPQAGQAPARTWKRCADWTEDRQATQVLRHELSGPAIQLSQFIQTLNQGSGMGILLRQPAQNPEVPSAAPVVPTGLAVTMADEHRFEEHPRSTSLAQQIDSALAQRAPPFVGSLPGNMAARHVNRSPLTATSALGPLPAVDPLGARPLAMSHQPAPPPMYRREVDVSSHFVQRSTPTDYFRLFPGSRPSAQNYAIMQRPDSYMGLVSSEPAPPPDPRKVPAMTPPAPMSHPPYGTAASFTAGGPRITHSSWSEASIPQTADRGATMYQQQQQQQQQHNQQLQFGQAYAAAAPASLAYPSASDAMSYFQSHAF